ncbi:hypothetical protein [Stenotrophomonas maltophilia]|nr:hypothetical protein [Stenotrophomonas maltophilia]
MSDHVALSTPDPVLERLSGGNLLEGTLKAVIRGGAILCGMLAGPTLW